MLVDYKEGERITLICIFGNILLSLLKGLVGYFGGSKGLLADAFHSGADVIATVVVFFSLKIAKKPKDENHPYGHGKIESIASAFVGITLIIAAFLISRGIIISITYGEFVSPSQITLVAAGISIILKEIMFRVTYNVGKKIQSEAVTANAWDHRSDALSSLGVFVGILGSIIGNYYNISFLQYLDPIVGLIVAIIIFKVSIEILSRSINKLMDSAPDEEKLSKIKKIINQTEGVCEISWLKGRYVGRHLIIDTAISVDGSITVKKGHDIALKVRKRIQEEIKEVSDVVVHVDPSEGK